MSSPLARLHSEHRDRLHCERRGLPRKTHPSGAGYRLFPGETAQQVRFLGQARSLGFSLREIDELLALAALASARK